MTVYDHKVTLSNESELMNKNRHITRQDLFDAALAAVPHETGDVCRSERNFGIRTLPGCSRGSNA